MALPVLELNWLRDINHAIAYAGSVILTNRAWIWALKERLIDTPADWSVVNSSDGTNTGGDRWLTAANLIWAAAASPHSWIVLEAGDGRQILISLEGASAIGGVWLVAVSVGGLYTGGTASARPTATDEIILIAASGDNGGRDSGTNGVVFHIWHDDSGENTRIAICTGGVVSGYLAFETPVDTVDGWANPTANIAITANQGTNVLTVANLFDGASFKARNVAGSGTMDMFMSSEGFNSAGGFEGITAANGWSGEWDMWPTGLASNNSGSEGRHGRLADIWYGSSGVNTGDFYPVAPALPEFVQLGCIILPWENVAIQLSV